MRGLILCLIVLFGHLVEWAEADKRPNILFAFADDWGCQASAYAKLDSGGISDAVSTPNFDQVASQGVLFRNAYVNAPSCTPCRSSLLSGQYFWRTGRGAILRPAVWDPGIPSWPLLLQESGYRIGKSWKVWSPGTPRDAPFGGQEYAYELSSGRVNRFSQTAAKLVESGASIDAAKKEILDEVRLDFRAFLNDQDDDAPFCYWFGPTNVHRKWIRGSGKTLWGIDPDSLKGKLPPFLPDVPEVRQDVADYLGEVEAFDASLGVLLEELRLSGKDEDTLIAVSGDHGPPGFPHGKCNLYDFGTHVCLAIAGPGVAGGRVVDDFTILPDLAPTFLEAGEVDPPAVMTARSLWTTLEATGEGLVDRSRVAAFSGRERHVAIARRGGTPYPQRSIRTAEYQLIINFRPDRYPLGAPYRLDDDMPPTFKELSEETYATFPDEDAGPTKAWLVTHRHDRAWRAYFDHAYGKRPRIELFDMRNDPHQMNNVAEAPAYREIAARLERRLMEELRRTGDPRLVNQGEFFETPPLAGEE